MITENLSTLKIHKLTQEQYDRELAAGNIDENALYLTPDTAEEQVVEVDTTLSVEGKAADAKAVGDALTGLVDDTLSIEGKAADAYVAGLMFGESFACIGPINKMITTDKSSLAAAINEVKMGGWRFPPFPQGLLETHPYAIVQSVYTVSNNKDYYTLLLTASKEPIIYFPPEMGGNTRPLIIANYDPFMKYKYVFGTDSAWSLMSDTSLEDSIEVYGVDMTPMAIVWLNHNIMKASAYDTSTGVATAGTEVYAYGDTEALLAPHAPDTTLTKSGKAADAKAVGDAILTTGNSVWEGIYNLDASVGDLSALTTTDKSSLVAAINEINNIIGEINSSLDAVNGEVV